MLKKGFETIMTGKTDENRKSNNTREIMTALVSEYIDQCIQCHRCMDVCPVTKDSFSINDLNQASEDGQEIPSKIKEFAFHCMQCGKCVPVCPVTIRRDYMVRYIKFKLKDQKPWSYQRYLFIKGPNLTGIKGITQKLYVALKKTTTRDLASFMETISVKKADVLFYAGCYIYSKKTVRQTLRLLNHLGCSYDILGGVTFCCGAPHMLQGEFEQADDCFEVLSQKIKTINPEIIITACAECFEVVEQIKKLYDEKFEILSVAQYLLRQKNKFPNMKIRGKITVHESCRFNKESPQGLAARDAAATFGELTELPLNHISSCCYRWNHESDPGNSLRRANYLSVVKTIAPTLVCNCLTCYEELKKLHTDVEIIDAQQLFEEALDAAQVKE
jgi:Fe-S oxidoreductase